MENQFNALQVSDTPGHLLNQIERGDDGIYGLPAVKAEQSVEIEMREKVAMAHHEDPLRHIAKHHSVPVMDHEVSRFLSKIPMGGMIIDVGGCWGWHWRNIGIIRPDVHIIIVDFVRANLVHARDLLGDKINRSIFLVHGDATQLLFPDCVFDGYWSVQTFQHIPSFDIALFEAYRVLKRGGIFANYSLNVQPHIRWLRRLLGRDYLVEGWVQNTYWLARASQEQKDRVEAVFGSTVLERWSEILYSPELQFTAPGRERHLLGRLDALLSNNASFLGWLARQRSLHCEKP